MPNGEYPWPGEWDVYGAPSADRVDNYDWREHVPPDSMFEMEQEFAPSMPTPDAISGDQLPVTPSLPQRTGAFAGDFSLGNAELDRPIEGVPLPAEAIAPPGEVYRYQPTATVSGRASQPGSGLIGDTDISQSPEEFSDGAVQARRDAEAGPMFGGLDLERDVDYSRLGSLSSRDLAELQFRTEQAHEQKIAKEQQRILEADMAREAGIERRRQSVLAKADADYAKIEAEADKMAAERNSPGSRILRGLAGMLGGLQAAYTGRNTVLDQVMQAQDAEIRNERALLADRRGHVAEMMRNGFSQVEAENAIRLADFRRAGQMLSIEQSKYAPEGTTALRIESLKRQIGGAEQAAAAKAREEAYKRNLEVFKAQEVERHNRATEEISRLGLRPRGGGGGGGGIGIAGKGATPEAVANSWAAHFGLDPHSKAGEKFLSTLVPLDSAPGGKYIEALDVNSAKQLRESRAAAAGFLREASMLGALIDRYGNEVNTRRYQTRIAGRMETLYTGLMFQIKSMEQAGALDAGMVEVVGDYLGDPSTISLNPGATAAKLKEARRMVMDKWADKVSSYAAGGDYRGWSPSYKVKINDSDFGLTDKQALQKLNKGETPEMRAEAAREIAGKFGWSNLAEGDEYRGSDTLGDAIKAGTVSTEEIDEGLGHLRGALGNEKDGKVRVEIGRQIESLERARKRLEVAKEIGNDFDILEGVDPVGDAEGEIHRRSTGRQIEAPLFDDDDVLPEIGP